MSARTHGLPLLPLLLLLAACPGPTGVPDGGTDAGEPECTTRSDCDGGLTCSAEGVCGPCESSAQCLLREDCSPETFTCEPKLGWDDACSRNDECQAGQWCWQGQCVERDAVQLCPSGESSECPFGQRCNRTNLVCEEDLGCTEDGDCAPEETCNPGTRLCVARCTVETETSVCQVGEKCHESRCVQCAQNSECGPQQTCDAAGRCVESERCYSDRECKAGLVCYKPTGTCLAKPPPCVSDESCAVDQKCEIGTGRCVPRACQPDRYEPNDGPVTGAEGEEVPAYPLTASYYEGMTLCEGDVDYFSISLARGDQLGIRLGADPFAESTFTTVIQDASGRTVASGRLMVSYVAPLPGTYYVAVSSTDALQTYDVTVLLSRGTPCDDDGWEPNDVSTQATPVNASAELEGAVCPQDVDHYALSVPAGRGVRVSLVNYVAASGLLELCLLSGAQVLQCTESPESPSLTLPADAAARSLTARVRGVGERTANAYTLQVEYP